MLGNHEGLWHRMAGIRNCEWSISNFKSKTADNNHNDKNNELNQNMVSTNVGCFREIQIQFKLSNGSQLEEPKTTFKHIPKPHSEPKEHNYFSFNLHWIKYW